MRAAAPALSCIVFSEVAKNEGRQLCSIEFFWDDDERVRWMGDVSNFGIQVTRTIDYS